MMSMSRVTAAAVAVAVFVSACGGRPMQAHLPVQIDASPGGPRYLQNGEGLDAGSLRDVLRTNPDTEGSVNGAVAARVFGTLAGGVGGGLIGWPLGRVAAGDPHPPWALAGVGGGLVGAGIILTIVSVVVMDGAVETHNRRFAWNERRPSFAATRAPDRYPRLVPYAPGRAPVRNSQAATPLRRLPPL